MPRIPTFTSRRSLPQSTGAARATTDDFGGQIGGALQSAGSELAAHNRALAARAAKMADDDRKVTVSSFKSELEDEVRGFWQDDATARTGEAVTKQLMPDMESLYEKRVESIAKGGHDAETQGNLMIALKENRRRWLGQASNFVVQERVRVKKITDSNQIESKIKTAQMLPSGFFANVNDFISEAQDESAAVLGLTDPGEIVANDMAIADQFWNNVLPVWGKQNPADTVSTWDKNKDELQKGMTSQGFEDAVKLVDGMRSKAVEQETMVKLSGSFNLNTEEGLDDALKHVRDGKVKGLTDEDIGNVEANLRARLVDARAEIERERTEGARQEAEDYFNADGGAAKLAIVNDMVFNDGRVKQSLKEAALADKIITNVPTLSDLQTKISEDPHSVTDADINALANVLSPEDRERARNIREALKKEPTKQPVFQEALALIKQSQQMGLFDADETPEGQQAGNIKAYKLRRQLEEAFLADPNLDVPQYIEKLLTPIKEDWWGDKLKAIKGFFSDKPGDVPPAQQPATGFFGLEPQKNNIDWDKYEK